MENEEDFFEMDASDFGDTPIEESTAPVVEETKEAVEDKATEEATNVGDETKLIEVLRSKVKYNGEPVEIKSIEDIVTNYQKGLNYDNLKAKQDNAENEIMSYINEKAKTLGISNTEYIKKVKAYEEEQVRAKNEEAINSMVDNGVPIEVAREVIETRALREKLQRQEAELKEREEKEAKEKAKEQEYLDFVKAYPNIEVDKIPKEVYEKSKDSNLLSAYREYENEQLKAQIKKMEQNLKNSTNSLVTPITEKGSVEEETEDAFLQGFNSVK